MKKREKILLSMLLFLILFALILGRFLESAPLDNNIKFTFIAHQIRNYVENYDKYPVSLFEINVIEKFLKDDWGRFFIYKRNKNKISLISYGKDGRPGGVNENKDICYSFTVLSPSKSPSAVKSASGLRNK